MVSSKAMDLDSPFSSCIFWYFSISNLQTSSCLVINDAIKSFAIFFLTSITVISSDKEAALLPGRILLNSWGCLWKYTRIFLGVIFIQIYSISSSERSFTKILPVFLKFCCKKFIFSALSLLPVLAASFSFKWLILSSDCFIYDIPPHYSIHIIFSKCRPVFFH